METTTHRVAAHTPRDVNLRIEKEIEYRLQYFALHPDRIDKRLEELDREWDIERTLEAQASALTVAGALLGLFVSRKWFVLPGIVGGFLLQHALQGWCPPVPIWRRVGVRTQTEIEKERYALKALRGDFRHITSASNTNKKDLTDKVLDSIN